MITSPFSPKGRVRRLHFFIAIFVVNVVGKVLDSAFEQPGSSPFLYVFYGLIAWPFVTLMVQRAHDGGRDGRFVAKALSLFIGGAIVLLVVVGLADGQPSSLLSIIAALVSGAIFLVGFGMTMIVYFTPGEPGSNNYGPNPRLKNDPINVSGEAETEGKLVDLAALRGYSTGD